jgi:hypothetical protein
MAFRRYKPPETAPASLTLVANSQKEALLLMLFEAYPREHVTDRRLAAYLPRVAPYTEEELEAVVNTWLDEPQHMQAPGPGALKALLERQRQQATQPPVVEEGERPHYTPEGLDAMYVEHWQREPDNRFVQERLRERLQARQAREGRLPAHLQQVLATLRPPRSTTEGKRHGDAPTGR